MKVLRFGSLFLIGLFWSLGTYGQDFTGTWNYKGHLFYYSLKKVAQGQRLVIKTTQKQKGQSPTSHTVYNTSIFVKKQNNQLQIVKILGSVRDSYMWSAMVDEYLRADFSNGKVNYTVKGEMMTNPKNRSKVPENLQFNSYSKNVSIQENIKSVIHRFIAEYHSTFAVIGKPVPAKEKLTGEILANSQKYSFEIKENTYGKGKGTLKIRQKGRGLLFESMINLMDKNTIKIHIAKRQGWAWAIYESDYEMIYFKEEGATFERTGRAVSVGKSDNSTLATSEGDNVSRAVQHFIERYHEIFTN